MAIEDMRLAYIQIDPARTYLQLPLWQWGAGNVYLIVLSSWKIIIAENPNAVMGLYIRLDRRKVYMTTGCCPNLLLLVIVLL